MKTTELEPYTVVVEKADGNYSAYIPELPGCITTGETIEEIEEMIQEAVTLHLEGLAEEGLAIPDVNFDTFRLILAENSKINPDSFIRNP